MSFRNTVFFKGQSDYIPLEDVLADLLRVYRQSDNHE